jgi:hypothetical protein
MVFKRTKDKNILAESGYYLGAKSQTELVGYQEQSTLQVARYLIKYARANT